MKRYGYLITLLLIALTVVGCSVSVSTPPRTGNLRGYVFISINAEKQLQSLSSNDVIIATEYLDPDFYMPLDGASVKVEGMRAVRAESDGSFYVRDIPVGYKRVTITDDRLREPIEKEYNIYEGENPRNVDDAYGIIGGIGHYIIIGISQYPNGYPILGPEKDARLIYNTLYKDNRLAGTGELLLNSAATWDNIRDAISDAIFDAENSKSKDNYLVLYFSGDVGRDFILPYDHNDSWEDRIFDTDLKNWLSDFPGHVTVIIEGPDSGSLVNGEAFDLGTLALEKTNFTVITSTQDSKEAVAIHENSGVSLFTYFVGEGIRTGEADSNRNHVITASELFRYTRNKMAEKVHPDVQAPLMYEGSMRDPVIYRY